MTHPAPGSPDERTRFAALQERLAAHFRSFAADTRQPYTAVVIPSQSFDPRELAKIDGVAHYEERSLFNLMLLRHPNLRVVYVTSKRLNPVVVDYYLHQMRGVPPHHARARLTLLDCDDDTPIPLTQKILDRPRLLRRIRAAIQDTDAAHMAVFNATALERTLSVRLGIPLNACDPDLTHLGSKTGSRRMFRAAGLQVAPGRDGLKDTGELVDALAETWEDVGAGLRRMVVKLDESFSGEGNAILELGPLAAVAPGAAGPDTRRDALRAALPGLRFEAAGLDWPAYRDQFDTMGGICEAWIEGPPGGKTSPSVQLRINPLRQAQAISTHDQVLGGPSGQIFLGCTFPADERYRLHIQELGLRVGEVMAAEGVIGRFGVDFLVVDDGDGGFDTWAVEINLRAGGTTHPFNTLKFLTDGSYDAETGRFLSAQGRERCYFATDVLMDPTYRGILPHDLLDRLVYEGMYFQPDETGVVFHLLGCLSRYGKVGCTAIADTVPEARRNYERAVALLGELGAGAGPD
jgi:hypothetical protein